ncbi:type 4 pilus major pilin [Actimicrobium sp. CCC2.4]|uniref:type 4 pilus major pilin n=1 Tax=Actimicrobium sp. CCC2.4 TaxID=3048606 RepID=UPI002AC99E12|nr:type 4 pilus major pilin [Actimicrobium sp. CCC2.4]MEB0134422.1 type 4 pilus major pilin [Actimicrobium sp. CCC2.4]WPX33058.1 type 4 pilus major pilin [Actimicrobium sp. CCC2.4]
MKPVVHFSPLARISRYQRGASLLEGIAYLGIAAIVVLGAVSLLTGAFSSAQSNRATEEVISIRTGVRKLFMGQAGSYVAGSLNATLISALVFPATISTAGGAGAVLNGWGGNVTVTGTGATFTIQYTAVPQAACINMISGSSGWTNIISGGGGITVFPATPAAATLECTVAGGAGNAITWTSN